MIKLFRSKNLKELKHGFFGRAGGSSRGIYSSLNVSFTSGDNARNIRKNRTIIIDTLKIKEKKVFFLNQQHTNKVVFFDKKTDETHVVKTEADAFITNEKNIGVGIVTADCAPILAYEADSGFIAGIHAGWKGALNGICENTILKLLENDVDIKKLAVAIGPCISKKNYEVKNDMLNKFLEKDSSFESYFEKANDKIYFDLAGFIRNRFEVMGIYNIETLRMCTYENFKIFFSNRRTCHNLEKNFGRMASVISL